MSRRDGPAPSAADPHVVAHRGKLDGSGGRLIVSPHQEVFRAREHTVSENYWAAFRFRCDFGNYAEQHHFVAGRCSQWIRFPVKLTTGVSHDSLEVWVVCQVFRARSFYGCFLLLDDD